MFPTPRAPTHPISALLHACAWPGLLGLCVMVTLLPSSEAFSETSSKATAEAPREAESQPLARPGPCAKARVTAVGTMSESEFSVVGPIGSLLSPLDVAAGPSSSPQPPPTAARSAVRPGSCETPGSGCRANPDRRAGPPANPPIGGGGRPTPSLPNPPIGGGGRPNPQTPSL